MAQWTLAVADSQRVARPNAEARPAMLRTALGGRRAAAMTPRSSCCAQFLLRAVLPPTSLMAWLYWKTYLGNEPADAAATAGWAIRPSPTSPETGRRRKWPRLMSMALPESTVTCSG